jgi:MOSC domain-containing protein YiiM
MAGHVVALYIAPGAGAPMQALSTAHLVPGRGIVGDRFYARRASAPNVDTGQSDVTLVEQEALDTLHRLGAIAEVGASARRNIVVRGATLQQLVGQRFCIGAVTLYGLAAPHLTCASPQPVQQDACAALAGTTLFARVLTEGDIAPGDCLLILDEG